jgi:hypothetical protein
LPEDELVIVAMGERQDKAAWKGYALAGLRPDNSQMASITPFKLYGL